MDEKKDPFAHLPRRGFYTEDGVIPKEAWDRLRGGERLGIARKALSGSLKAESVTIIVPPITTPLPGTGGEAGPAPSKRKKGRPSLGEPWKLMDPPISRRAYFQRKKEGKL